jgi:uncharacterized protein
LFSLLKVTAGEKYCLFDNTRSLFLYISLEKRAAFFCPENKRLKDIVIQKINKTALFLLLTFVICWSMAGTYYLLRIKYSGTGGTVMALIYMFVPMLSAILVEKVIHRGKIKATLLISFRLNKWFLVAWLITPVIGFAAFGISLLLPGIDYDPEMTGMISRFEGTLPPEQIEQMRNSSEMLPVHPIWLALLSGLVAGLTINAVAGFGEELGWRGFLLRRFREMHFMQAALITGFVWGIWHAPLILMGHNYPQHPEWGLLMMTAWCILLSPLFLYITLKARSVIAAAVMHGTLNGTAGVAIMMIDGGTDLTTGITGFPGFIALFIVLAGFFLYDRFVSREKLMCGPTGASLNWL